MQKFNHKINSDLKSINDEKKIINIANSSSNWKYLAYELLGSYYLKKNENDKALQSLNAIIDADDSKQFIKERAKTLVEIIKKK